jgi:hypothetical protein
MDQVLRVNLFQLFSLITLFVITENNLKDRKQFSLKF